MHSGSLLANREKKKRQNLKKRALIIFLFLDFFFFWLPLASQNSVTARSPSAEVISGKIRFRRIISNKVRPGRVKIIKLKTDKVNSYRINPPLIIPGEETPGKRITSEVIPMEEIPVEAISLKEVASERRPIEIMPNEGMPIEAMSREVIIDSLKRRVEVPFNVKRILSLQPEISRLLVALGHGQNLVGLDRFLRFDDHLFPLIYPPSKELPLIALADEGVNAETILRFSPEVVFVSPSEPSLADSLSGKLSIPVIALSSMGRFDLLLEEISLLGRIVNNKARAAELRAFFEAKLAWLAELLNSLSLKSRPRVYLAFWSSLVMTPVNYDPVKAAGGLNLAEGLGPSYLGTARTVVTLEQILRWNPEIILIHGNYPPAQRQVTIEKIIQDKRLRSVEAVRKKRVYYTFGFWYWWDPAEALFECFYLASLFYPEILNQLDLKALGEEIFGKFYSSPEAFSHLLRTLQIELPSSPLK